MLETVAIILIILWAPGSGLGVFLHHGRIYSHIAGHRDNRSDDPIDSG